MSKLNRKWLPVLILVLVLTAALSAACADELSERFQAKAALLQAEIVTEEYAEALGDAPAGAAGYAVFFSVCDGNKRASVLNGTGESLSEAWDAAVARASEAVEAKALEPRWVKADVVYNAWQTNAELVRDELSKALPGFDFNGIALDDHFETALLEGELNGAGIYDYEEKELSLELLNAYLKKTGRETLEALPYNLTAFECKGWFCDENDAIYPLIDEGADCGRRVLTSLDADYARDLIDTASAFLAGQVNADGSFVYGLHPQYDRKLSSYNIVRHSGTVWSLVCRYRMFRDEALVETIEKTIDYMLSQLKYDDDGAAYLYESKTDEIKLGGCGIAVVAMTEYMDVFRNEKYRDVCVALGEGILKQMDPETGGYWHVLAGDLSRKEEFRTVYYDGEATFALARLYGLTGDQRWLDAACRAVEHFIEGDYTQYRDHWVSYSLNEVTKYVEDRQDFYDFALANATDNFSKIQDRARTFPTNLELLISCFETWQRMVERGVDTGDFDLQQLLDTISSRANRQLSGYFYPELAMYMKRPGRVLGAFMIRNDRFRVRIDDVQHNIGGFYLYWKNYDALVQAGMK